MARTLILKWNPAISSYTMERFQEDLLDHMFYDFNWSIWEHEQLRPGDRFFLIRVGEGKTGLAMAGTVISNPYKDEDWSGKGRETYYADLDILDVYDTDTSEFISTEELQKAIPDFEWNGGHSGMYLTDEQSEVLELLYEKFRLEQINGYAKIFNTEEPYAIEEDWLHINLEEREAQPALAKLVHRHHGSACEKCGYDYRKVFGNDCQEQHEVRLFGSYKSGTLSIEDYHCICENCANVLDT